MPLRKRKPTSPGRRFQTVSDFSEITKPTPEKSLLAPKPSTGGRNNYGRKTARHRGGGHKQRYRIVDFKRNKDGVPAKVAAIEYDPNRNAPHRCCSTTSTARSATSSPPTGCRSATCCRAARVRRSGPATRCRSATSLSAPTVHNVELKPGAGGKMARRRGHERPAGGQGGRLRHVAAAEHRDAPGPDRLPGHRRRGRQRRGRAASRSARPDATGGRACGPRPAASP